MQQRQQAVALEQPGGEIMVGTPVIAAPAYPEQRAPPLVLFGRTAATGGATFYYSQPQGFQPSPFAQAVATATPVGQGAVGVPIATGVPIAQGVRIGHAVPAAREPRDEVTASFTNGDLRSTDVRYAGDAWSVSHANFFWNDIERLDGLGQFPNLIRLTLRGNHLTNLVGLDACPHLRWLDISVNDLTSFSGANQIASLEWLCAESNHLRTLDGLGFAPNLTWLSVANSDLTSLLGLRSLPNLRALDASKNELTSVDGVASCAQLIELRLGMNVLTDISQCAHLRELRAIDASSNELSELPTLGSCAHLHTLSLAHNNLGSHSVQQLIASFSNHRALSVLAVGRNGLAQADVQRLCAALAPVGCHVDFSDVVPLSERTNNGVREDCACAIS